MSEKSKLVEQLQDKAYREAFVFSQMSIPISFQIRALREQRGLTQQQLAEKAHMLQPRIVELERPKGKEPNLRTLGRLAAAFDVALIVRFAPFSELVEWAESFSPDTFIVPSYDEDLELERGAAAVETDPTQRNPFQSAIGVVTRIKNTSRLAAMPFIAPKPGEEKVSGGVTYDRTEKNAA